MSEPRRVQLSRRKGWKMPENTINVARPSKWGNPFRLFYDGDRTECVGRFRAHVVPSLPVEELRGKNLACWCSLEDECHADVLLEIANGANP